MYKTSIGVLFLNQYKCFANELVILTTMYDNGWIKLLLQYNLHNFPTKWFISRRYAAFIVKTRCYFSINPMTLQTLHLELYCWRDLARCLKKRQKSFEKRLCEQMCKYLFFHWNQCEFKQLGSCNSPKNWRLKQTKTKTCSFRRICFFC